MQKHLPLCGLLLCVTMYVGVTQAQTEFDVTAILSHENDLDRNQMQSVEMALATCRNLHTAMTTAALKYGVLLADDPKCERMEQNKQHLAVRIRDREIALENMKAAIAAQNYAHQEHSSHEAICLG